MAKYGKKPPKKQPGRRPDESSLSPGQESANITPSEGAGNIPSGGSAPTTTSTSSVSQTKPQRRPRAKRMSPADLREALARERGKTAGRREALREDKWNLAAATHADTSAMSEEEKAAQAAKVAEAKAKLQETRTELDPFRKLRQEAERRDERPPQADGDREGQADSPVEASDDAAKGSVSGLHPDKKDKLAQHFGGSASQKPKQKSSAANRAAESGSSLIQNLAYTLASAPSRRHLQRLGGR